MTQIPREEWRSEGTQRVEGERVALANKRFEKDIEYATKSETHLWVATVMYRLSQGGAESIAKREGGFEPRLDMETLITVEFGCYVCEQPLMPENVKKRCTGDPSVKKRRLR